MGIHFFTSPFFMRRDGLSTGEWADLRSLLPRRFRELFEEEFRIRGEVGAF